MRNIHNKQSGVASIFVVLFFMILISIITVSFVAIVSQDQKQATNADLNASAYDSAQAGVEDAKRALDQYRKDCVNDGHTMSQAACETKYTGASGAFGTDSCERFLRLATDLKIAKVGDSEVSIETTTNDKDLNQSYTCLKVNLFTDDYQETIKNEDLTVIPLKSTGGQSPHSINVSWHTLQQGPMATRKISNETTTNLPTKDDPEWGNQPAILRTQIIAVPKTGQFGVDDIDDSSRAVFLYPHQSGANSLEMSFQDAGRKTVKNSISTPIKITCTDVEDYPCSTKITNFAPNPSTYNSYNYYLLLRPLYNTTKVKVQMFNASDQPIQFDGIGPEIDSTGRTNDVYRRVVSRVKFGLPDSLTGVNVSQGICKDFQLADAREGTNAYDYYAHYCPANLVEN